MDEEDKQFVNKQFAENTFPLFQWSSFAGKTGEQQFVVRANDPEAFLKGIELIKQKFPELLTNTGIQTPSKDQGFNKSNNSASDSDICPIHQVKFIWSKYPSKFTGNKFQYHYNVPGSAEKACYKDKIKNV